VDESVTFDDMEPLIEVFYTSFPDYKNEIESIFAAGDMVAVRLKFSGTHQSKFMGIEAKGKTIQYRGILIFQLTDGKISKIWGVEDELTMMTQLGLEFR
jgi:predicted ester cyclase